MKVAVPVFGEEISPRFGCSTHMLIATIEQREICIEDHRDLSQLPPWRWPDLLASLGVTTVVCGGMHRHFQEAIEQHGIQVIWGVIGPASDALVALQKGTLQNDQFICRGRHRHRRGGWRGPPGAAPGPWTGGSGAGRGFRQGRG